ncbi:MAG TPA: dephospho-CoA kinase [Candidatus Tectomicrobia bacterium]|nr:dephospho-CoA kinase [Candidatus Tectomicrobia bacterium]
MAGQIPVIGLTGGIGAGKSTVTQMLEELGAAVIDADRVGHQIYLPDLPAWREIVDGFGGTVLNADRTINRQALGRIVFADPEALRALNRIVHPKMFDRMAELIAELRGRGGMKAIVVEAAVLIEANWQSLVDQVWVVVASEPVVVDRLAKQRSLSPEQVRTRIAAQLSDDERLKHAHVVIRNDGSLDEVRSAVQRAWDRLCRA